MESGTSPEAEATPQPSRLTRWVIALLVGGLSALWLGSSLTGGETPRAEAQTGPATPSLRSLLTGFDPSSRELRGNSYISTLPNGNEVRLTLDPGLQAHMEAQFVRYEVPFASLVAIEPDSGRVLAFVDHSSENPGARGLALDPTPPTASVFKIISAAALVDQGIGGDTEVCYHGGHSRLSEANLEDSDLDRDCATLAEAVGGSINSVFAKLAVRHLSTSTLSRYATAFGFGEALPFDFPTRPSPFEVPDSETDRLEFARTSAGFWHMHMSPLHGALIASTFANEGEMPVATMTDEIVGASGEAIYTHEARTFRRVLSRQTALQVGEMMERTVSRGTARRSFHDPQGRPFLPNIRVAGKTGTLSGSNPYRGYTWWVGYAPLENPTIAVAALVVNTPRWRIKASYAAREALRQYLVVQGNVPAEPQPAQP